MHTLVQDEAMCDQNQVSGALFQSEFHSLRPSVARYVSAVHSQATLNKRGTRVRLLPLNNHDNGPVYCYNIYLPGW